MTEHLLDNISLIARASKLKHLLENYKDSKRESKEKLKEIRKTAKEILDYIDQNEELKAKLNEEIKNNEALLKLLDEENGYKVPEFNNNEEIKRVLKKERKL